jgi:hypothetical protein
MAVFSKTQAKRLAKLDDFYMSLLDALQEKGVLDTATHRRYMLTGYYRLVEFLQQQKLITAKQSQEAMTGGFTALVNSLAD